MTVIVIAVAVLASGVLVVLRRRLGRPETSASPARPADKTTPGVHAGFTNHF